MTRMVRIEDVDFYVTSGMHQPYVRGVRRPAMKYQGYRSLRLGGEFSEPVRKKLRAKVHVSAFELTQYGKENLTDTGYAYEDKQAIHFSIMLPEEEFAALWTMASAGHVKFVDLWFLPP